MSVRNGQYYWYTNRRTGEKRLIEITSKTRGENEWFYDCVNNPDRGGKLWEGDVARNIERVYKKDLPLAMLALL